MLTTASTPLFLDSCIHSLWSITLYVSLWLNVWHTLEDAIFSSKGIASKLVLQLYLQWVIPGVDIVSNYWVVWQVVGPEATTGMDPLPDLLLSGFSSNAVLYGILFMWIRYFEHPKWMILVGLLKTIKSNPYEEYNVHFYENSSVTPDVGRIPMNSSCYQGV